MAYINREQGNLICWRCGRNYIGIHGKDNTCPYCIGDLIRVEELRKNMQKNHKSKNNEGLGGYFSTFVMFLSLLGL